MSIAKHMEAIFAVAVVTLCAISYPGSKDETPVATYTVTATATTATTPSQPANHA